ncbi:BPSL0761 family protein [Pseudomonas sp. PP3]|uniref:BPSL0761 family protein n=1 Tax=Pseudomonas sp. PP3 TaxID=2815936 RepID=UPI0032AF4AF7
MTMPNERTRAVISAGVFLREISQDITLNVELRDMADQILRHYPSRSEVLMQGQFEASYLESFGVSPFFSPSVRLK